MELEQDEEQQQREPGAEEEDDDDPEEEAVAKTGRTKKGGTWADFSRKKRFKLGDADEPGDEEEEELPINTRTEWQFTVALRAGQAPELFCRQCCTLLPDADATLSAVQCIVCKHATPIALVTNRVLVSHWTAAHDAEREKGER